MKESFADESWSGNLWYRHMSLAHITSYQNLSWFFQLKEITIKKGLILEELKAHIALKLLDELDFPIKNIIWQSLQNIIIMIVDPKHYIRKFGIEPLYNSNFQFESKGKKIIIDKSDKSYTFLESHLQKYLSEWMLIDSPLSDIKFAIDKISDSFGVFLHEDYFSSENILALINKEDLKKRTINVAKLSLRFNSAFFELEDPETKKSIGENLFQYNSDYLFFPSHYYLELLRKSISNNRFFDEGHLLSISIIKKCYEEIKTGLSHETFDSEYLVPDSIVEELDSKKDFRIQAADVASGIARHIFETNGLKGLKERFNYIIFNGRKI